MAVLSLTTVSKLTIGRSLKIYCTFANEFKSFNFTVLCDAFKHRYAGLITKQYTCFLQLNLSHFVFCKNTVWFEQYEKHRRRNTRKKETPALKRTEVYLKPRKIGYSSVTFPV
ncbi:hypothetical protein HMPREF9554_02498 [Treponema phagedenis F0421]|nr:hypothetical protein HMPREF9554_02498 [Treponema phagedenis F0421]